jgi:hypothetical protein
VGFYQLEPSADRLATGSFKKSGDAGKGHTRTRKRSVRARD